MKLKLREKQEKDRVLRKACEYGFTAKQIEAERERLEELHSYLGIPTTVSPFDVAKSLVERKEAEQKAKEGKVASNEQVPNKEEHAEEKFTIEDLLKRIGAENLR